MRLGSALSAATLVASGLFAASVPAAVLPATATTGSSLTFQMNGFYDTTVISGLSGLVTLDQFSFANVMYNGQTATKVTFGYSISNTSSLVSSITNLAFNTTPNIIGGAPNTVTGIFDAVKIGDNQPNGIGKVELCFTDKNCPGGNAGIDKGQTGGGTAALYFLGSITSLTFDQLYIRYQRIVCPEGIACQSSASGNVVGVPEPGPLSLALVLAVGGLTSAWLARRRRIAPAIVSTAA